jgi:hypothetical protein
MEDLEKDGMIMRSWNRLGCLHNEAKNNNNNKRKIISPTRHLILRKKALIKHKQI